MDQIKALVSSFFKHKSKFFVAIISAVLFVGLLFPFGDLADLVSTQVAKLSGNSVFIALENIRLSFFPQPGMTLERVFVETNKIAGLSVRELTITPSVSGIAAQKPYGHISARGIMGGDVQVHVNKGTKTDNGIERQSVEIKADKLSLYDIRSLASLPVVLKGQMNLESSMMVDLSFQEQPDIDIKLHIDKFEMPPSNLNTSMGPITLPDLKMSKLEIKGRLSAGKLIIENGQLGGPKDELSGKIKGSIDLQIQNLGGSPTPRMGGYNIELDFNATPSFQDKAGLFLALLSSYKRDTAAGANYKFKVSAENSQMPPSINAVR